jgi:hypothetical protein
MQDAFDALKARGSSAGLGTKLYPFPQFSELMGFDWVSAFDKKYNDNTEKK